jgi:hypothetical protein
MKLNVYEDKATIEIDFKHHLLVMGEPDDKVMWGMYPTFLSDKKLVSGTPIIGNIYDHLYVVSCITCYTPEIGKKYRYAIVNQAFGYSQQLVRFTSLFSDLRCFKNYRNIYTITAADIRSSVENKCCWNNICLRQRFQSSEANLLVTTDGVSTYVVSAKVAEDECIPRLYDAEVFEKIDGVFDVVRYCSTKRNKKRGNKTPEALARIAENTVHKAIETARAARLAVSAKNASTQYQIDTQRRLAELSRDVVRNPPARRPMRGVKKDFGDTMFWRIFKSIFVTILIASCCKAAISISSTSLLRFSDSLLLRNRTYGVTRVVLNSASNLQRFADKFVESLNLQSRLSDMALEPYDTLEHVLDDLNQTSSALSNLTKSTARWQYDKYEVVSILVFNRSAGRVKRNTAVGIITNVTNQVLQYQRKIKEYYNAYNDLLDLVELYAHSINNLTSVWFSMLETMDEYSRNTYQQLFELSNEVRRLKRQATFPTWSSEKWPLFCKR